ncbi:hypothetical protein D3C81_1828570 [compost metagenome]
MLRLGYSILKIYPLSLLSLFESIKYRLLESVISLLTGVWVKKLSKFIFDISDISLKITVSFFKYSIYALFLSVDSIIKLSFINVIHCGI